jgi:hypothetical protein
MVLIINRRFVGWCLRVNASHPNPPKQKGRILETEPSLFAYLKPLARNHLISQINQIAMTPLGCRLGSDVLMWWQITSVLFLCSQRACERRDHIS